MGEGFKTRGGGGGIGKLYAVIGVEYPAGSECSCTNGEKTLKAKDTSGKWLFAIPEAGTWTVTATDGTNSKSVDVEITTQGQSEKVVLSYWSGELYDSGNEYSDITGGIEQYGFPMSTITAGGSMSKGESSVTIIPNGRGVSASTVNKIDLTDFNTLHVNILSNTSAVNRGTMFVASDRTTTVSLVDIGGVIGEATLDVSDLNGEYYLGVGIYSAVGVNYSLEFNKLWLNKESAG